MTDDRPFVQPPFHVITNRDIWEKLVAVETAVNGMVAKTEQNTSQIESNSQKIRALEIKVYGLIAGLIAALGLIVWGGGGV